MNKQYCRLLNIPEQKKILLTNDYTQVKYTIIADKGEINVQCQTIF